MVSNRLKFKLGTYRIVSLLKVLSKPFEAEVIMLVIKSSVSGSESLSWTGIKTSSVSSTNVIVSFKAVGGKLTIITKVAVSIQLFPSVTCTIMVSK